MKNKNFVLLLVGLIGISSLFAQQLQVKGTVVDAATAEPLIGVKVLEKGTNNGTITNFDGEFSLSVPTGVPIVISYIGYLTKEINATGAALQIKLDPDTKLLDEVVV